MSSLSETIEVRIEARDRWQNDLIRPLTAQGIFLGAVHFRQGTRKGWRLYFTLHTVSVGTEEVKEAITNFIQGMYSGVNLTFYRTYDGLLYVVFDIGRD